MEEVSERLPKSVVPSVYHLILNADLTLFTFKGDLQINVSILEPVSEIVLNASELDIKEVSIQCCDGKTHEGSTSFEASQERATFNFNQPLPVGPAVLKMSYSGIFNDKLTGLYRSKNLMEGDYCVATFFEPTYARACLPCWDEPAIKAVFDISVIADHKYTVLSNMNEISSEDWDQDSSKKLVKFAPSPIMSTYLLALSIGAFGEFLEAKTSNGVNVRVYLSEGNIERGKFALKMAVFSLEFFEKFFGIQYPLPKSDNFALNDFWMGAMENWGLIIYRRSLLEVDEQKSSKRLKQNVATVVAHEYAHQWFGNLVTMEWWTHLWLNEGFASFLETVCTDAFDPNFQILTQFVNSKIVPVMKLDSLESSHPVEVPIKDTKQIMEIFDLISYSKGASINRMLYNFLGGDVFRKGLTNYLNHFAYKNASTDDLWNFLGDASGIDVQSMMASWTRQTGFPYLTIEESGQVSPTKRKFVISQKRFLFVNKHEDATENLWHIPISIVSQSSPLKPVHQFVLKTKSETIEAEGIEENDWVHFNPSFSGFFITKYPEENYERILKTIKSPDGAMTTTFSPEGRMSFIFDCAQLAYSGLLPISLSLNVLKAFTEEEHYCVWSVVASCLLTLQPLFIGSGCPKHKVSKFKTELFKSIMDKIGFEDKSKSGEEQSHMTPMLRSLVIAELGFCNYEPVVSQCRKLFTQHVIGSDRITSGDVRKAVFNVIAANVETPQDIDPLLRLYSQTDMVEEKIEVLAALGNVSNERVLLHVMDFCMGPEVSPSNVLYFVRAIAANYALNEEILKYLQANLELLVQRMLNNEHGFVTCLTDMCKCFFSVDKVDAMYKLRERSKIEGYDTTYEQTEEVIRVRADRISHLRQELTAFFDAL